MGNNPSMHVVKVPLVRDVRPEGDNSNLGIVPITQFGETVLLTGRKADKIRPTEGDLGTALAPSDGHHAHQRRGGLLHGRIAHEQDGTVAQEGAE
jgi:hypothetical protein